MPTQVERCAQALKRGKFDLLVFPGVSREPVAPGGVRLAAARPHSYGPQNMAFQNPDSPPCNSRKSHRLTPACYYYKYVHVNTSAYIDKRIY